MDHPAKRRILKLFGESAIIRDDERDEARSYLNSWKKYLLRRLIKDSYAVKVVDEQWGEIPAHFMGMLAQNSKLYLKLIIEFDWLYTSEDKVEGIDLPEREM
jgi:predicted nucleotidyltransferase